jgi:predicted DNA-binding ribbon-helix-helix protein
LAELVVEIDSEREGNLSSALPLYILRDLQSRLSSHGDGDHLIDGADPEAAV